MVMFQGPIDRARHILSLLFSSLVILYSTAPSPVIHARHPVIHARYPVIHAPPVRREFVSILH
jgi:hypothetical protein